MIAGSLSLALSCKFSTASIGRTLKQGYNPTDIHRSKKGDENSSLQTRILVLSVSPDAPSQYIPIMNCIFGAKKFVRTRLEAFVDYHGIDWETCCLGNSN
jgi:hypothetical protein